MNAITIIGFILAGVGGLAGFIGYYGKARGDSIIAYQAKDITALKSLNDTLESEKATLIAERDSYKRERDVLAELAQGSPQLVKLTQQVANLARAVKKIANKDSK